MGVMLLGDTDREAPAQAECSPYLRRGLLRQPAPDLNAYGVNPGLGYAFMALRSGYTALITLTTSSK
jgi:hypothetical protein